MIGLYKAALGPLLIHQANKTWTSMLSLPEAQGARIGTAGVLEAGLTPLRVVFVGDSTIAGVGVDRQDEALASQAAELLHRSIHLPVQWQLHARRGINTRQALALVTEAQLEPADLLVISLGANDVTSQRTPAQFIADYTELLDYLSTEVRPRGVIVNGLAPFHILSGTPQPLRWYVSLYARRLDEQLQQLVARRNDLHYLSLQWANQRSQLARDGFHPGPLMYRQWAQLIAHAAAGLVAAPPPANPVALVDSLHRASRLLNRPA